MGGKNNGLAFGLTLEFGTWDDGTIAVPELKYALCLLRNESGWKAVLGEIHPEYHNYESPFLEQQPKVMELIADLNRAIQSLAELDLSPYIEFWEKHDEDFTTYVHFPDILYKLRQSMGGM